MITLDLTPTEEARVVATARQIGLAPAEYVKKLVQESLPSVPTEAAPAISARSAAAVAQLQAWKEEDATDDPEELRQADADLNELLQNLNKNRIESGERPLSPDASYSAGFKPAQPRRRPCPKYGRCGLCKLDNGLSRCGTQILYPGSHRL